MSAAETKLEEVRAGRSAEYLGPLKELQEKMGIRIEVTAKLREFRMQNLRNKTEAEELAARQNYEVLKKKL
jgi:breast cancer metastasis-suppressor 1-like protein